jgi:hypothetical protein
VVDSILADLHANQLTASDAWLKQSKQQGLEWLKAVTFIMNFNICKADQEAWEWPSAWKLQLANRYEFGIHLA